MKHPIPVGTSVVAAYEGCKTCGPGYIQKVGTRIDSYKMLKDGTYIYTLLDGRQVSQSGILEVRG